MNRENLIKMAEYTATIPQDKFDMFDFRKETIVSSIPISPECNSVGCVIGHCTILDKENFTELQIESNNYHTFFTWSEEFTGLDCTSEEWDWCFSGDWSTIDNTPLGASKRIMYLLEHGLPDNFEDQILGDAPLCYI